jgi:hypothetical protein
MSETGEVPLEVGGGRNQGREREVPQEKELIILGIGRMVNDYWQESASRASRIGGGAEEIKGGKRRLVEAMEIGRHVSSILRSAEASNEAIASGVSRTQGLLERQEDMVARTFGRGEVDDFVARMRRERGEWGSGKIDELLTRLREAVVDPVNKDQELSDIFEELQRDFLQKNKGEAEELEKRTRRFETDTYKIGDQCIRTEQRTLSEAQVLRGLSPRLSGQLQERLDAQLNETRGFYRRTEEPRTSIPSFFRQIGEATDKLGFDLRRSFDELSR